MTDSFASIPQQVVGPIHLRTPAWQDDNIMVPLATFESPIWATVKRGAKLSQKVGGIYAALLSESMTRSILLEAENLSQAMELRKALNTDSDILHKATESTSNYAQCISYYTDIVGKLLYLRLTFDTDQAAGHNMATKAADAIGQAICAQFPHLTFVSVSANTCTDKKNAAINGILGRGKSVVAEMHIDRANCKKWLRTTPEKIQALHIKKNLMGSVLAGSVRSANAHFANMILALYLATGQDGANVVEGSQGITHVDVTEQGDLYFSVTLPNLIVGTVGNGKNLAFVRKNLQQLKCLDENGNLTPLSSQRLALITAATVLCGELSLLAAQTNPGELTRSHMILERKENP